MRQKDFVQMDCGPHVPRCLNVECEADDQQIVIKYCGKNCSQAKCANGKSANVKECRACDGDLCNSAFGPLQTNALTDYSYNRETMPKEQYMCQLCANHGQYNQPKKGHKLKCPNRHCT
uniref:Uncharacterized protein n=1 Tax=Globodera rostochiensis TaxID=31243 RepID=A0A914HM34_GLORO